MSAAATPMAAAVARETQLELRDKSNTVGCVLSNGGAHHPSAPPASSATPATTSSFSPPSASSPATSASSPARPTRLELHSCLSPSTAADKLRLHHLSLDLPSNGGVSTERKRREWRKREAKTTDSGGGGSAYKHIRRDRHTLLSLLNLRPSTTATPASTSSAKTQEPPQKSSCSMPENVASETASGPAEDKNRFHSQENLSPDKWGNSNGGRNGGGENTSRHETDTAAAAAVVTMTSPRKASEVRGQSSTAEVKVRVEGDDDSGCESEGDGEDGLANSRIKRITNGLAFNVFLGLLIMAAVFSVGSAMLYAVQKILVSSSQHNQARINRDSSLSSATPPEPIVHPKDLSAYLYEFNLRRRSRQQRKRQKLPSTVATTSTTTETLSLPRRRRKR